ncbi:MAG: hypoxanthine phosphoribosyltransferase [Chloroflexi bacterium]|nr:hypoxanthine phosphoribosyltransferase [Chloroflexota bacterium]MCL5076250.1 hypoxanthine phosphoribosyltransferase [Chloroflexota bacterium]
MTSIANDVDRILISPEELQAKIRELGKQITHDYQGKNLMLVGILKGAVMFMADLIRAIDLPLEIDFMAISSYGASTESSGVVRILKDLDTSLEDKDVLIVEDIVDTGLTLRYIRENLWSRNPASLRVCTLLNKQKARKADVQLDYVGFEIPDHFVIGYGLDFVENYRNLPFVGILKAELYAAKV